ncbi:Solute carrier family 25 member 38 homolog [Sparassis crispa]|uniref:Mitochondrial glycine transporter n=1 Tax=Sparassis crispa TaxID=139825 RepID=A0A401GA89_9APHY|nr:Solute carrier family 25 member 38 homolog [Sparassis crispa]GBE79071.1 Solute carrier family 25 member 38 homolog [Sparassis crispa]
MSDVRKHLLSGALSGLVSTVCLQPLDLLKTRMQQVDGTFPRSHNAMILETAREIFRTEGLRGLWRGTTPTLLRNIPGVALYFTGLNYTRNILSATSYFSVTPLHPPQTRSGSVLPKLSSQGNLLAGAVARVAVGVALNPVTVLKARYESNMYAYQSLPGALLSLLRSGPSEVFRGVLASSLRDAPYAGLFVVCYEGIKSDVSHLLAPTSATVSAGVHGFSAASAGVIATMATHPFDVIKTKMQVRTEDRYHGLLKTVSTIWHQRGVRGFFDGAALRVSRKPLSSALAWAVYEGMLMFMRT